MDIGGSKVLAVVLDDDGEVVGRAQSVTRRGPAAVVEAALDAAARALSASALRSDELVAVGVGIPGVVAPGTGGTRHAVNLGLGVEVLDLAAALRHALGRPVWVENDVNAAALGAFAVLRRAPLRSGAPSQGGATEGRSLDLGLLSIGTGLAAGVVIDGRLHRGHRGAAGEIGHLPLDPRGLPCSCGQRGCLETVASGAALAAAWSQTGRRGQMGPMRAAAHGQEQGAPDDVWESLALGDPRATETVTRFARGVAAAVRILVLTWDLDRILLAGGVTQVGAPLLAAVRSELDQMSLTSSFIGSLELASRVDLVPPGVPVAAIGAALSVPVDSAAGLGADGDPAAAGAPHLEPVAQVG